MFALYFIYHRIRYQDGLGEAMQEAHVALVESRAAAAEAEALDDRYKHTVYYYRPRTTVGDSNKYRILFAEIFSECALQKLC